MISQIAQKETLLGVQTSERGEDRKDCYPLTSLILPFRGDYVMDLKKPMRAHPVGVYFQHYFNVAVKQVSTTKSFAVLIDEQPHKGYRSIVMSTNYTKRLPLALMQ